MKKLFYPVILIVLLSACKKDNIPDEVTYEVTLVNSTTWWGVYIDENLQGIGVSGALSGWTHSFKNITNLCCIAIDAYPNGSNNNADAYMKIYVNGNVVASGKSSVSPRLSYTFP